MFNTYFVDTNLVRKLTFDAISDQISFFSMSLVGVCIRYVLSGINHAQIETLVNL